ncbi:hypothetical protein AB1L42_23635 [Thalassoglobus sp. JC818]|uniref:hypothetical protein n=1 Tax=Thalassoglobus sp. JC818 TaxID=3232136 RepID=UPI0034589ACB
MMKKILAIVFWTFSGWAALIVTAFGVEYLVIDLFDPYSGPEHGVPIPVSIASAILFGWIPTLIVTVWRVRSR